MGGMVDSTLFPGLFAELYRRHTGHLLECLGEYKRVTVADRLGNGSHGCVGQGELFFCAC